MSATATRRVRVKRPTKDETAQVLNDRLDTLINEYMAALNRKAKAETEMEAVLAELKPLMEGHKVDYYKSAKGVAEYKSPRANSRTIIDPAKFRELVSDPDFLRSIEVKVTKARELIAGKTLDNISRKVAPEKKPKQATIRPLKKDET